MSHFRLALIALSIVSCYPKGYPPETRPLFLAQDFPVDVGPYLVHLSPGRFAVVIEHDLKAAPTVSWSAVGSSTSTQSVATKDGELWIAELEGLPSDRDLIYSVDCDGEKIGPIPFRAGRPVQENFSFGAFGDTRTGHEVHRALVLALARENLDFVVHSGDIVETGGVRDQWRRFFQIEGPSMSKRPLLPAVGNHDNSKRQHFRRYFLMGRVNDGKRYYVTDWGNVRVVNMDSEIEMRPGSEQHDFLTRVLSEGAERNMLMILNLHYPPYSSGSHGSTRETRSVIGDLAPRYGVEVVLAGHDHNYERTKRIDGVTYMVAASGGAPVRKIRPSWFSARVRTEPHFVIFDVARDTLTGRAVNLEGEVFDSFVIENNPPHEPGTAPSPKPPS